MSTLCRQMLLSKRYQRHLTRIQLPNLEFTFISLWTVRCWHNVESEFITHYYYQKFICFEPELFLKENPNRHCRLYLSLNLANRCFTFLNVPVSLDYVSICRFNNSVKQRHRFIGVSVVSLQLSRSIPILMITFCKKELKKHCIYKYKMACCEQHDLRYD